MNTIKSLAAASVVAFSVGAADAAVHDTYALDLAASSIDVTLDNPRCRLISCGTLTGSFGSGAGGSWTPTSEHESISTSNFFDWTVGGFGLETFDVAVNLVFASPEPAGGGTSGSGGFGTLFGVASAGGLVWNGPATINFSDGSRITAFFDNVAAGGLGNSTSSGAKFKGEFVAAVPLPAGMPLVLGGLALLGWAGRRKKAA